jgi:hypothetical protein
MSSPFSETDQHVEPMLTPTQQFWLGHWQQWQASGLSMAAYAREQGLSVKSFYYWSKQVRALKADKKPEPAQAAHYRSPQLVVIGYRPRRQSQRQSVQSGRNRQTERSGALPLSAPCF